jgi:hypothetical protein
VEAAARGIERLVTAVESEHRSHADDELAPRLHVRGHQGGVDVGKAEGLHPVTQVAAQSPDRVGEELAVRVQPGAILGEVVAELTARLLKDVHVQPPWRAEYEGDAAEDVRALRKARDVSAGAQTLPDAEAGPRAEEVVVTELDEAAPTLGVAEADAEVEVPGLALPERDLDVGEGVRRGAQRIDRHGVEGGELAETTLSGDELVRDQDVA